MNREIDKVRVLIDLGRLDAARAILAKVLATEPDNVEALAYSAQMYYITDQYEKSIEHSARALREAPDDQFALQLRAFGFFQLARRLGATREAAAHRQTALDAARRCVELGPDEADNQRVLAAVMRDTDPEGALVVLSQAIERHPQAVSLHVLRGIILRTQIDGGNARAAVALREALRLDPENVDAIHELALNELAMGKPTAAIEGLRTVARMDPTRGDAVRDHLALVTKSTARDGGTRAHAGSGTTTGGFSSVLASVMAVLILICIGLVVNKLGEPNRTSPSRNSIPSVTIIPTMPPWVTESLWRTPPRLPPPNTWPPSDRPKPEWFTPVRPPPTAPFRTAVPVPRPS